MSARADIVIVNWNSGHLLAECLASIRTNREGVDRVIVVDNGSTDGSLAPESHAEDWIEFDAAGENLGFAAACNRGAARCTAPFILFLNPDAQLIAGGLPEALRFMTSPEGARVGICGVRLLGRTGAVERHCANFTDPSTYVGQALGLADRLPRVFTPHFMRSFDHLESRVVDQVIGAFFLVRRPLFEQLNGFDERYFVYFEEVDFALRAKQAGWDTFYLASATGYHYGGGTSEKVKARRLFYSLRSRLIYARRHFSPAGFVVTAAATLAVEPVSRLAQAVLRRSLDDAGAVLSAYRMLLADMAGRRTKGGR
ncbi:glycosyltransferase [Erythrobacteraceae bacterium CFH 75059]|uniref:glycosyltransferase family 2 protein n=1 Tax=Qipengyuania thermophila TaxID=2509361 RepID=UPI0010226ECA|nr:glycosyltransferase family 2 protein [Qipengyuania thermophila]TCD04322.1 glycosyltransferase [Erythrobacteraceae bacterium CFH 75059]